MIKIFLLCVLVLAVTISISVTGLYIYVKEEVTTPREISSATLRNIQQGTVIGFETDNGAHAWLGIPYAQPPVATLRWKAPRPAIAWPGTYQAVDFSSDCSQPWRGSEDCLYLNIWAPNVV